MFWDMFLSNNHEIDVLNWTSRSPHLNIRMIAWSMLSTSVYDDLQPQNVNEVENRVEKTAININVSYSEQLVNLFNFMAVRIACKIEKKVNRFPKLTISGGFSHGHPKCSDALSVDKLVAKRSLEKKLTKKVKSLMNHFNVP